MGLLSLKHNAHFKGLAYSLAAHAPARLVYHPRYFRLLSLLREYYENSAETAIAQCHEQLAKTLRRCLTSVPHYMDLGLAIRPNAITAQNALEVLQAFPYLEKADVMADPSRFLPRSVVASRQSYGTSGGSTGEGIKTYRSMATVAGELAFFHFMWRRRMRYSRGSRQLRFNSGAIKALSDDPFTGLGPFLYISPYHVHDRWLAAICDRAVSHKTEFIHGYPSCLGPFIDYLASSGRRLPQLRGISLGSEAVPMDLLKRIADLWPHLPVVFHYGLSEGTNLAWGRCGNDRITYDCEETYGHTESLVRQDGETEIVGTSYWNDLMPLLRYRTQDLGRLNGLRIESLDGRAQEFLITKQGTRIPGFSVAIDKFLWDAVSGVQVVQNRPGAVEFHLVPRANFCQSTTQRFADSQHAKWGAMFDITIHMADSLPRTKAGKMRLIVNNVTDMR